MCVVGADILIGPCAGIGENTVGTGVPDGPAGDAVRWVF